METRFIKKQMTAAYQYSYTRLALNYYTLYETLTEEPELPGKGGAFLLTSMSSLERIWRGKRSLTGWTSFGKRLPVRWRF